MKGILVSWHANGYGMVSVGEQLYFLHRTSIVEGDRLRPEIGSAVAFEIVRARKNGKFEQAVNAVVTAPEAAK